MRYLLTVILVLALASPAWSLCNNTPRELLDVDDTDRMPVTSSQYDILDCETFNWTFNLTFTDIPNQTTVYGDVLGSDVPTIVVDSDEYTGDQRVKLSNSGNFSGAASFYQLRIDVSGDTGHWSDMDFTVKDQSE